jgi:hypothetical protein
MTDIPIEAEDIEVYGHDGDTWFTVEITKKCTEKQADELKHQIIDWKKDSEKYQQLKYSLSGTGIKEIQNSIANQPFDENKRLQQKVKQLEGEKEFIKKQRENDANIEHNLKVANQRYKQIIDDTVFYLEKFDSDKRIGGTMLRHEIGKIFSKLDVCE